MSVAAALGPNVMQLQTVGKCGNYVGVIGFVEGNDVGVEVGEDGVDRIYAVTPAKFQVVGDDAKRGQRPFSIS